MPQSALRAVVVEYQLQVAEIGPLLVRLCADWVREAFPLELALESGGLRTQRRCAPPTSIKPPHWTPF